MSRSIYMSLALIKLPRVGSLPPLHKGWLIQWLSEKPAAPTVYPCVFACMCMCISEVHRVDGKAINRRMKVRERLLFCSSTTLTGIDLYKYDFILCFLLLSAGLAQSWEITRLPSAHVPSPNTVKSITPSPLCQFINQFWISRFSQEHMLISSWR